MARALERARSVGADAVAVELIFFRSRLASSESTVDESARLSLTAMLVNLSDETSHSDALCGVGFALSGLTMRKKSFPLESLDKSLRDAFLASYKGRTNFVVLLPGRDLASESRATAFLATLRAVKREFPGFVGTVIAVAQKPTEWSSLDTVDGFVCSDANNLCRDASAVLALMSTSIAPTVLTCSADFEVLDAVGTAATPSRVILGTWDYGDRRLSFQDEHALRAIARADAISLSPLWLNGTWGAAHELMRQLRPLAAPEASCIYNVCTDFFLEGLAGRHSCPVVLLCKSALSVVHVDAETSNATETKLRE